MKGQRSVLQWSSQITLQEGANRGILWRVDNMTACSLQRLSIHHLTACGVSGYEAKVNR